MVKHARLCKHGTEDIGKANSPYGIKSAYFAVVLVFSATVLYFTLPHIPYRLNRSASAPVGLWKIVKLERPALIGERVFVCLPEGRGLQIAKERGYLSWGLCPGGVTPLIKTIAAKAETRVTLSQTIAFDGLPVPDSPIFQKDAGGHPMPVYTGGIIPDNHLFLFSDEVTSYDSRYFGPIHQKHILGKATPVLTF